MANSLVKLSLLFFYHRIFPSATLAIIANIAGAFVLAWCLTFCFVVIFNCRPVQYYWDKSIQNGHCINGNLESYLLAATNVVGDIVILILPIPWLVKLQLDTTKKIALIGTFLLGGL